MMYRTEVSKHWSNEWDTMAINYIFASKRKPLHNTRRMMPPPPEHVYEKRTEELNVYTIRGYSNSVDPIHENGAFRPPIYPVCWGWNAGGRSGNSTALELREPRLTHKSGMRHYISAAAGTHHSLLVSNENIVYSFGEGRNGQLGYGNDFMHQPGVNRPKGGFVQSCPRAVTPSGNIQYGHDLKISQVACGASFSIAREMTTTEGVSVIKGLEDSEDALKQMKKIFFDSDKVQWAWSHVRQERYRANRISEGRVTSWGTGLHGELGLGPHLLTSPRPRIIPRLQHVNIAQIAAGRNHCLAVSSSGYIYSWGSGRAGKLGHEDWEDRFAPLMIKFFESFFIEYCAAGDAHSAVLTTNRKGMRGNQLKRVSTFGRGAHGRLGNNGNRSSFTPVPVIIWPPSLEGAQFHSIACGGAHTVALASISIAKTAANPWGTRTFVLTWGYGCNGQLGTGYLSDSFVPVKSRMPKSVIIAEIAAGKSWSMARSIGGELFTWGKGLRGQLGQGSMKLSFAPRKVKTFASFVKLGAGYAHNVCLTAPKKFFNPKISLRAAENANVFAPLVPLTPKQQDSDSLYSFDCCRRHLSTTTSKMRFICRTCAISSLCIVCLRQCHRNHDVVERRTSVKKSAKSINPLKKRRLAKKVGKKIAMDSKKILKLKQKSAKEVHAKPKSSIISTSPKKKSAKHDLLSKPKIPYCRCGMFNSSCRVIPVIPEGDESQDDNLVGQSEFIRNSALKIQRVARTYIERQHIKILKTEAALVRFEVCSSYWQSRILKQIWVRLERARQKFREEREMAEMLLEDATRKRFDYFYALQTAVGGMDAIIYGTKALIGAKSIFIPRVQHKIISEAFRPTFAFTWASVRQQQLYMHPHRRIPLSILAELTRNVARFEVHEANWCDPDVCLIFRRFMRDFKTEKFRSEREKYLDERESAKKMRAERARAALIASKFTSKSIIAQAQAITRPTPPALPPPPYVLALQAAEAKAEKKRRDYEIVRETEKLEDAPFDMYGKSKQPRVFRRNTICAPENLFNRLLTTQAQIPLRSFSKRRNSLPPNCKLFHPYERPSMSYVSSTIQSLSMYYLRDKFYDTFINPKNQKMIDTMKVRVRKRRLSDVMGSSALFPRLPREMNSMIADGYRRRTVAEPERLSKQLHVMFEIRNKWSELRIKSKDDERMSFRRRSFDYGEIVDDMKGITDILGYEFEEPYRKQKILEIRKDGSKMERYMVECGFIASKLPAFKGNKFGSFLKRNLDDEEEAAKKDEKKKLAQGNNNTSATKRLSNIRAVTTLASNNQLVNQIANKLDQSAKENQVWQEHFTENGETYYFCPESGESSWEYPQGNSQLLSQYQDENGYNYWYNWSTGDSFYE